MNREAIHAFLTTELQGATLGEADPRPTLDEAYAVYRALIAFNHPSQIDFVGPVGDFVETLRNVKKSSLYSDEEWIEFFQRKGAAKGYEAARDLWDGLLCQPE